MKCISYVGRDLLTGDRIADAIMDYATVLARRARADRVDIPVLVDDRISHVEIILGPASQIAAETVTDAREDPVDEELIADLQRRAARLKDPKPMTTSDGSDLQLPDQLPDELPN
jgi:hypothetical protein